LVELLVLCSLQPSSDPQAMPIKAVRQNFRTYKS
jgi:hypothetical protein